MKPRLRTVNLIAPFGPDYHPSETGRGRGEAVISSNGVAGARALQLYNVDDESVESRFET